MGKLGKIDDGKETRTCLLGAQWGGEMDHLEASLNLHLVAHKEEKDT